MNIADYAPFLGTIGGGFVAGVLAGYAIRQVIRIAAVIIRFIHCGSGISGVPENNQC